MPRAKKTELLVSVRSATEVAEAHAGGASIIDVKEPENGALGSASAETLAAILAQRDEYPHCRWTAALGELFQWDDQITKLGSGWHGLKIGLSGQRREPHWRPRLLQLAKTIRAAGPLIPVAYADADLADAPPIPAVLELALEMRAPYFLIDTFTKDGRRLLDFVSWEQLSEVQERCRCHGISCAFAGSLSLACIDKLALASPDVLAVRGAACVTGNRRASVCRDRVRQLRDAITQASESVVQAERVP